ncbi:MAG: hypothetical protein SNJ82_10080 [Gemmataceae bacterium]
MQSEPIDRSTPKPPTPDTPTRELPASSGQQASPSIPPSWWLALALLAVIAAGVLWWRWPLAEDAEEALVQQFVHLLRDNRTAALKLLGPAAEIDLEPVSEAEAEARACDYFLRLDNLKVVEILPGTPDGIGKQQPLPHFWTLVTRANGSTPPQRIRTRDGVSPPRSMTLTNPDLVIQVRQGKLIPVRTELPLR